MICPSIDCRTVHSAPHILPKVTWDGLWLTSDPNEHDIFPPHFIMIEFRPICRKQEAEKVKMEKEENTMKDEHTYGE